MKLEVPSIWGTKKKDIVARREMKARYIAEGKKPGEAEKCVCLELFRHEVSQLIRRKKIAPDRLVAAINEAMVMEVQES